MNGLRFLFRCDADATSGFGHISRCLNIALEILQMQPQAKITFMGNYSEFAQSLLVKFNFERIAFKFTEANNNEVIAQAHAFTHLLVDSYFITQSFIDSACNKQFKFILLDDFCAHSDYSRVDLLLNFTIQAPTLDYNAKKCALGISYFPVKPELKAIREMKLETPSTEIKKIAFCISAMPDYWPLEAELVKIVDRAFTDVELLLVSSRTDSLEWESVNSNSFMQQKPGFEIEKLYAKSDFIISGGGLVKYECAYCGVLNATLSLTAGVYADTQLFEAEKLTLDIGTAFHFDADFTLEKLTKIKLHQENIAFHEASKRIFNTNSTENLVTLILTC
ncbi:MAG: hypothetical protein IPP32_14935 [Bacteroidetes bacterium]|nr:hypothetical protein [Bacteroidota bacterium]